MNISIITINYNNVSGLQKTIDSVLSQSFRDFEFIIIDGGSNDGSKELIESNQAGLTYWVSEADFGIYNAMNKGISHANGRYLLFMQSGRIFFDSTVLENAISAISKEPANSIIYGQTSILNNNNHTSVLAYPDQISLEWLFKNNLNQASTFIPKIFFERFGFYDESFEIISDWLFLLNVFLKPGISFRYIPIIISSVQNRATSVKFSKKIIIEAEKNIGIKKIVPEFIPDLIERNERLELYFNKIRLSDFLKIKNIIKLTLTSLFNPVNQVSNLFKYYGNTASSLLFYKLFKQKHLEYSKKIPIIINNRNRLTFLKDLIKSLEDRGCTNIFIIDNNSTFPPLLDFYKTIPYKIYYLKKNVGFCALWDSVVFNDFHNQFYIYTDSDLVLTQNCPDDFLCRMYYLLLKYKSVDKIGLGLVIDDLPKHYEYSEQVVTWESELIKKSRKLEKDIIEAAVDTTFAMYRKNKFGPAGYLRSLRTFGQLQVKHLPWYLDSNNLNEEEKYYLNKAHTTHYTHWTAVSKQQLEKLA